MRALSRVFAALIGLLLVVAGVALAVEATLSYAAGRSVLLPLATWLRYGREHPWGTGAVKIAELVVLAVGVLMLIVTLRRRKPTAVPGSGRSQLQVSFARRPLESALVRLADRHGGVEGVSVRLRRRTVAVRGATLATDVDAASDRLAAGLGDGLARLPLASTPKVNVKLTRSRS